MSNLVLEDGRGAAAAPEKASTAFGAAMFLLLVLFFWVGTDPYSGGDSIGVTATATQSNLVNQIVTLLLTAGVIVCALTSPMRSMVLQPRVLLTLIIAWLFFTAFLSTHPFIAGRKVALSVLTVFNASMFLLLPRSRRQMALLLLIGTAVTLGFAYFGVVFLPLRGIHQATDTAEPMLAGAWRGHYSHKNAAAACLVVLSFFCLYGWSQGYRKSSALLLGLCVFFLLHTGGKTSTAMLPFIMVVSLAFRRWKWTRVPVTIGGVAAFNIIAVGAAVYDPLRRLVTDFGVDASFTNRADIWRMAFAAIAAKPIFGYGLDSFWRTPEIIHAGGAGVSWAVAAFNAHNTFLDMTINAGIFGLLLMLVWMMILPLFYLRMAEESDNDPALTLLFIRLWLYGIYSASMESMFFQNGSPAWFCMMVAVFGMRLQAKARLV